MLTIWWLIATFAKIATALCHLIWYVVNYLSIVRYFRHFRQNCHFQNGPLAILSNILLTNWRLIAMSAIFAKCAIFAKIATSKRPFRYLIYYVVIYLVIVHHFPQMFAIFTIACISGHNSTYIIWGKSKWKERKNSIVSTTTDVNKMANMIYLSFYLMNWHGFSDHPLIISFDWFFLCLWKSNFAEDKSAGIPFSMPHK